MKKSQSSLNPEALKTGLLGFSSLSRTFSVRRLERRRQSCRKRLKKQRSSSSRRRKRRKRELWRGRRRRFWRSSKERRFFMLLSCWRYAIWLLMNLCLFQVIVNFYWALNLMSKLKSLRLSICRKSAASALKFSAITNSTSSWWRISRTLITWWAMSSLARSRIYSPTAHSCSPSQQGCFSSSWWLSWVLLICTDLSTSWSSSSNKEAQIFKTIRTSERPKSRKPK